jgi:flagellar motor switch protein FliM
MFLSNLLETEIKCNRVAIAMQAGDIALVFRLLVRLGEGQVLKLNELCEKDYTLGLLKKLK